MGVEETAVHLLDGEVEPMKVALPLLGSRLFGRVDDAEMHVVRVGCFDAGQIEESKAEGLVEPLFALVAIL